MLGFSHPPKKLQSFANLLFAITLSIDLGPIIMAPFEGKTGFEKGLMELVAFGNGEGDCCSGI